MFYKGTLTNTPLIFGNSHCTHTHNGLYIFLYFYLDVNPFSQNSLRLFNLRLSQTKRSLSITLGCKISLISFNYYSNLLGRSKKLQVYSYTDFINRVLLKVTSFSFLRELLYYYRVLCMYLRLSKKLSRFHRHQYFYRTFNILFSIFSFRKFDLQLLVNLISYELRSLRKQHNNYLKFIKASLNILFSQFRIPLGLRGLVLEVRGCIIPFNRQVLRKQKKTYKCGLVYKGPIIQYIQSASAITESRFGAINILLKIQLYKCFNLLRLKQSYSKRLIESFQGDHVIYSTLDSYHRILLVGN